jgi:hypothetical protein
MIARFQLMNGLAGCYMPDHHSGPYEVTTRREMIAAVREQLEWLEFPKRSIRQVRWTMLWGFIKRHGASSVHVQIVHKGYCLDICGLTEDEAAQMNAEND